MYFKKEFIIIKDIMNVNINPKNIKNNSYPLNSDPIFINFKVVAPSIVGIAKKKENSVAATLLNPKNIAPIIVAAEREVPGIIARH